MNEILTVVSTAYTEKCEESDFGFAEINNTSALSQQAGLGA